MSSSELYIAEQIMHSRLKERRQDLELRRHAAAFRPNWLARKACSLLCGLGSLLVALGERLESYDLAKSLPLEEVGTTR